MKTPMKLIAPSDRHIALHEAVLDVIRDKMADVPAVEVLAVLAYTVGQLVAMQDQRKYTSDMVMALVYDNILKGNVDAVDSLLNAQGGSV